MLLLNKLSVHLWLFPSEDQSFSKVFVISMKSRWPPEGVVVSHLRLPALQMLRFPMLQRLLVRNAYNNPMFFDHFIFNFSESCWRPHSSYIFDMTSTCHKDRDPLRSIHFPSVQFLQIFPAIFHSFYVSAIRRSSREVRKHQPAYRNMKRLKAFMPTRTHCA